MMFGLIVLLVIAVILFLYIFAICPRLSHKKDMIPYQHTMFAHRGYHCMEKGIPENSMKAFAAALAKGYGIELDLHLTKDRELVVFHDDTLQRMCGRPETVEDLTAQELTSCHLLGTSDTIPLFRDVLSLVSGKVPLLIELKIPSSSLQICEETLHQLQGYHGEYLIQSFNTMGIRWFRLHAPQILRGQLSSNLTADNLRIAWIFRFVVKHLLSNFLSRPDFISYKFSDLPVINVWILKNLFHIPIAVWTLRTPSMLTRGRNHFDIQIFEKPCENY